MDALSPTLAQLLDRESTPGKTRYIALKSQAIDLIGSWVSQTFPTMSDLVICDLHTRAIAERVMNDLVAAGRQAKLVCLDPAQGDDHLVCDDEAIAGLTELLRANATINPIAVGSGTINDIAKMASFALGRDYICVPTAASMNGYTSTIGAVLSQGVKRTLPAHQPAAIFADLDVITEAPPHMNQAGFGDLLSKPYSHADWLLSHLIRDVPYDSGPSELLDESFNQLLAHAGEVGAQSHRGIESLMETLLLSGFSMAMAGTSAPASGGEHLVSHYWDMEQHCNHQSLYALHGTQVGIATRCSALLFDRLVGLEEVSVGRVAAPKEADFSGSHMAAQHPALTPDVLAEVIDQISVKQKLGADWDEEMKGVVSRWPQIREVLIKHLLPSEVITKALEAAGCAAKPSDIGVTPEHAIRTLTVCRHIRSRYVALDLMADLGLLHEWAVDVVNTVEFSC